MRRAEPASIPDDMASLLTEVMRCHKSGQLTEAVAMYDRILSLKSDIPEVHCNRALALAGLGRLGDAEAAYRQAIVLNPKFPTAYVNLGDLLRISGRLEDSEETLRCAIALSPQSAEAFSNLGNTLKEQRRPNEAEAAYRQAIALKPHFGEAYSNLGNVLLELGRLDEAEKALRQAIALRPQFADAFSNLGNTLREQGRLSEAEVACRQAIALKPHHTQAHSNLGNALNDQGRLIEAEAAYRRAIALNPKLADAYNNLSVTLKNLGGLADARWAVERAIKLRPRNSSQFLNLCDLRHFRPGDPYLAAMEELARNIALLPVKQQIEMHFALAKAYEDVGRGDDSFQQLLSGNALKRRQIAYDEAATLRGFERIRAAFTPELIRTLQDVGEPSSVPLFIVGMPRSGTTLIEQILASHPLVFGAGELPNLGKAAAKIRTAGGRISPFPEVMLNISSEHMKRLGAHYVTEISQLAPTAAHVTDKMPSNFFFVGLIHLALPNARIIHAVRDPVDTCISCFSKLFAAVQHHTYDLAELGRYYRRYQALMEHWHRILPPGRILDVRYEDVVADLEGQSRRILVHCGLEWDARCLAFHETERSVHTASATQVRRPIYSSSIGRWRAHEPFLRPLIAELSSAT